jgi:DNA-binding LacI/PurR family transcriptional regulator/DNA-binding FadR family transcriptional regulator
MNAAMPKAFQTVEKLIQECGIKQTRRLPTIQQMATTAGVSTWVMKKAIKVLSRQGVITASPKTGITINFGGSGLKMYQKGPSSNSKCKYIVKKIETEILPALSSASFILPSSKELSHRFGVSHPTLQKALSELLRIGRLQRYKKGYALHQNFNTTGKKKIIVIWSEETDASTKPSLTRSEFELQSFEMICAFNNVRLKILKSTTDGRIDNRSLASVTDHPDDILGFMVFTLAKEQYPFFHALQATGKPVAVLDEGSGEVKLPFLGSGKFRIFQAGMSGQCGSTAAYYLKDHGHKHIAYLSIFHDMPFSQVRLQGIFDVVDQFGEEYSITPFCNATQHSYSVPSEKMKEILKQEKREYYPSIGYSSNRYLLKKPVDELCEKALRNKRITAWIAANDFLAFNAIDYLGKRGIRVPGDLSIIGFDDTLEAVNYHLTTYNFNSHALMHGMFNFLIDNQRPGAVRKQSEVDAYDGYIVERETVGNLVEIEKKRTGGRDSSR